MEEAGGPGNGRPAFVGGKVPDACVRTRRTVAMLAAIVTPSKGRALGEGLLVKCGRNRRDPNSTREAGRRRERGKAGKAEGPRGEEHSQAV